MYRTPAPKVRLSLEFRAKSWSRAQVSGRQVRELAETFADFADKVGKSPGTCMHAYIHTYFCSPHTDTCVSAVQGSYAVSQAPTVAGPGPYPSPPQTQRPGARRQRWKHQRRQLPTPPAPPAASHHALGMVEAPHDLSWPGTGHKPGRPGNRPPPRLHRPCTPAVSWGPGLQPPEGYPPHVPAA